MNIRSLTRRLRPRFSLRTLFIAVAVLCLWMGHDVNWINERHAFLARERDARLKALSKWHGAGELQPTEPPSREICWTVVKRDLYREKRTREISYSLIKPVYRQPGPGTLWLYGEDAEYTITIVPSCGSFDSAEGFEPTAQDLEKFKTARSLFPEAEINWQ